jgi:hypothetical protein
VFAPLLVAALLGSALVASPAQAATPDRWGFAFLHTPTPAAGTVMDMTRQWGGWKSVAPLQWATVDPIGAGRYRVRFPLTASLGVAQVTAVSNVPHYCQVANNQPVGADQVIDVACYRQGGAPSPTRFAITYSSSSGVMAPPGGHAYVVANQAGALLQSYNSVGAFNAVGHLGPGQYQVALPGVGTGVLDGHVQVTAQHLAAPRRCKVASWAPAGIGHTVRVHCVDHTNTLVDTGFNLTYQRERAIFGGFNPPRNFAYLFSPALGGPSDFNSQGGANTIFPGGPGLERVHFDRVGVRETHVQVTAFGFNPDYCQLQEVWQLSGTTVIVRNVICFNGAGVMTNNPYLISYTSRV